MFRTRFVFIALSAALTASTFAGKALVEDHGRLGQWIRSSKAAANIDHDGDDARPGVPVLETPGDGPAPVRPLFSFAPAVVSFNGYTSVQVNVDANGNNIVGDAANEPSIAMDPANPKHLVIGWRQFDSVESNFRQAGNAYSLNGGASWINQAVLTRGTFRSDPVVQATGNGNVFYLSLMESFYDSMFQSTNAGETWNLNQLYATGGDKEWFTVDTTNGIGHGNQYQSWSTAGNNYNEAQFSRSVDGGYTWQTPLYLPNYPIWGTLDVDLKGNLYIGGLADTYDTYFTCVRSSNAKDATQTPSFDQVANVNLGGTLVYGQFENPGGLAGQCFLVADKSTGLTRGNLYMLASVGVNDSNPCQVNFARSTDGGKTWSNPVKINDDPLNNGAVHWFGTIAVAPNGRIDVLWLDNRSDPTGTVSALYYRSSPDGGITWLPSRQVTPKFDSTLGWPDQNKIGDYLTVVSDTNGANVAYSATFNGEEDIWFLRIPAPGIHIGSA
jgi:hypothetical protein